jgi:5-methylcytosine-specific restriction endonuclease McrA
MIGGNDREARVGRLKQLAPVLTRLPPRIGFLEPKSAAEASRDRDAGLAYRRWYKTARWQRLRWSVLVRDLFTCGMCRRLEADTSKLVADHKVPHRGSEALFWDDGNLWCLCKGCHDSEKQRQEARLSR